MTRAPAARAMSGVASREPSSTTTGSTGIPQASTGRRASTSPMASSSSRATTIAAQRPLGGLHGGTAGSRTGTSGHPRAPDGASTPSRLAAVVASSSTDRGSALTAPGSAPLPHTTNGTGVSPQSR